MEPPDGCQKKTVGGGSGCKAGRKTGCSQVQSRSPLGRSVMVLNLMWAVMGSQWREMKSGVTWERLGRLKIRRAAAF